MKWVGRFVGFLIVGALLSATAVRMWGGDPIPPEFSPIKTRAKPHIPSLGAYKRTGGLFWPDYVSSVVVQFGEGSTSDEADANLKDGYSFSVRRGAPTGDTWPLSVEYGEPGDAVQSVSLRVTSDESDPDARTRVAELTVLQDRGWTVGQALSVPVPSDTTHLFVDVVYKDGQVTGVGKNVPSAPTLLGRIADRLSTLPILRHLPDNR